MDPALNYWIMSLVLRRERIDVVQRQRLEILRLRREVGQERQAHGITRDNFRNLFNLVETATADYYSDGISAHMAITMIDSHMPNGIMRLPPGAQAPAGEAHGDEIMMGLGDDDDTDEEDANYANSIIVCVRCEGRYPRRLTVIMPPAGRWAGLAADARVLCDACWELTRGQ